MSYAETSVFFIERHVGNIAPFDAHFHSVYEFYYLKNGTATYLMNDKIYDLAKGDIMVIPPNTLHKTVSSGEVERERILIYLDRSYLEALPAAQAMLPSAPIFCHVSDNVRLKGLFEDMLEEVNTANHRTYIEALICELLVLLGRTAKNEIAEPAHTGLPEIIRDILAYIAANYTSELTLQHVAQLFYTNPSYLSRLFKQHTGFTFCSYLNNYRIKEANKLLAETDRTITEIAMDCGFNSLNNFCKCYKRIMNTSPLSYRKKIALKKGGA